MVKQIQETRSEKFESVIPENWALARFDDVVYVTDYVANGSFASLKENVTYLVEPDYAVLVRFTDYVKGWNGNYKYVDEHAYNFLSKSSIEPGDIVIANVGDPGKLFIVPSLGVPMTLGPNSVLVRPLDNDILATKYLAYFYQSAWGKDLISQITTGTAQQKFNKTGLRSTYLPIAPPEQQKRIVAKIEELFSHIDAGIEALKKAKQLLKQYRQSVLKAAVTGELTKEWREANKDQLEPASQLLERILKVRREKWEEKQLEQFKAKGKLPKDNKWKEKYKDPVDYTYEGVLPELPEDWVWVSPEQIASTDAYALAIGPFGSNLKVSDYRDEGVPLVFVRNIRRHYYGEEGAKYVTQKKGDELKAHSISSGDILITKMGEPPGDASVYPLKASDAIITADCIKWRFSKLIDCSELYVHIINSPLIKSQVINRTKGVAQKKISLGTFKSIAFPLPPLGEQEEVLRQVKQKSCASDRMMKELANQLVKAEKNKQSILASAFSGHLLDTCKENDHAEYKEVLAI